MTSKKRTSKERAKRQLTVTAENADRRLDNLLLAETDLPRPALYRLIRIGAVRLNGRRTKPHARLQPGDEIQLPPKRDATAETSRRPASRRQIGQLDEIGRGKDYRVIDKPAGLAVQGGTGIGESVASICAAGGPPRLRLVHRLDKETSGCLVLAASLPFARSFQQQLQQQQVEKQYICLVRGAWDEQRDRLEGELGGDDAADARIHRRARGRRAITEVEVLWRDDRHSLLLARPLTGRTHQLRIQFSEAGWPLVGDRRYGRRDAKEPRTRLCLHAWRVSFADLQGKKQHYQAPVPQDIAALFDRWSVDLSGLAG